MFVHACNTYTVLATCASLLCSFLQYFQSLRDRVIALQSVERQSAMQVCFDNLMEGIERNLQSRNRDK